MGFTLTPDAAARVRTLFVPFHYRSSDWTFLVTRPIWYYSRTSFTEHLTCSVTEAVSVASKTEQTNSVCSFSPTKLRLNWPDTEAKQARYRGRFFLGIRPSKLPAPESGQKICSQIPVYKCIFIRRSKYIPVSRLSINKPLTLLWSKYILKNLK